MFPNTPEASQWVSLCFRGLFGQFGVTLKTIYLFGCLRGTLVVTKVLAAFFVSSEGVSYPRGHEVVLLSSCFIVNIPKVLGDLFFFNNNRNVLILKCENTTFENRS